MIDGKDELLHGAAPCSIGITKVASTRPRISVGLSPAALHELTALADDAHVSVSWIGERAILEFLERHRQGEVQLPLIFNDNHKRGAQ